MEFEFCKIEVFLPKTHLQPLQEALVKADAGHMGNYSCCMSYYEVTGCWMPLKGSSPYIGEEGTLCREKEYKVEVLCKTVNVEKTIKLIKQVHPYEVPVINVIPVFKTGM